MRSRKNRRILWILIGILYAMSVGLLGVIHHTTAEGNKLESQANTLEDARNEARALASELTGNPEESDLGTHAALITREISKAVAIGGGKRDSTYKRIFAAIAGLRNQFAGGGSMGGTRTESAYRSLLDLQQAMSDKMVELQATLRRLDDEESQAVVGSLLGGGLLLVFLSITFYMEQKRLSESERTMELFRKVVRNYPRGISIIEVRENRGKKELRALEGNKASAEITGITIKAAGGKDLTEVFPLVKEHGFTEAILSVCSTGQPVDFDEMYIDRGIAKPGWYTVSIFPLTNSIVGASFGNIDNKKKMEIALRESEERWQLVVWGADDGIWDWNIVSNSIFYSDRWCTITGYRGDGSVNHLANLPHFVHPDDLQRVRTSLANYIRHKVPIFSEEYRIRTAGGEYKWVQDRGQAVFSTEGKPLRMAGSTSDIDRRKSAEEALREERIVLRTLIDNLPDIVYIKDRESRRTVANKAHLELLGLRSESEVVGKTDFDLFPKEVASRFQNDDLEVIRSGVPSMNLETEVYDSKGKPRWFLNSKVPMKNDRGEIIGLVGIAHDITPRKLFEEGLQESERRLSEILQSLPSPTMIVDKDGTVVAWNHALEILTGIPADDVIGQGDYIYALPFYGERRPVLVDMIMQGKTELMREYPGLRTEGNSISAEAFVPNLNGREAYFHVTATALRNSKGEITGGIETILDITDRRKVEIRLRASEEKYRLISENAIDMIAVLNSDHVWVYASPSYNIDNMDPDKIIGQEFLTYVHPEDVDQVKRVFTKVVADYYYRVIRFRFGGSGGKWRIKEATVNAVLGDKGTQTMVVMKDITENVMHERERATLQKELQGRNAELERTLVEMKEMQKGLVQSEKLASIGQLVAGVAHEINNPLAFVHSNLNRFDEYFHEYVELADEWERLAMMTEEGRLSCRDMIAKIREREEKAELKALVEDFNTLMSHTRNGAERIRKIVEQLRGFTRLSNDGFSEADLNSAVDDTLSIVWNEIKYKAVVKKEYGSPPPVVCNPGEIKQVFVNLLVNAAQSIKEKGEITIRTGVRNSFVFVDIIDTGSGISPENLTKIFDPFFTTKPVGKGTGLGLWVSTSIIQKHSGRIEVESEPGKGTKMTVLLPVGLEAQDDGDASSR